jgi:hypothetical protein
MDHFRLDAIGHRIIIDQQRPVNTCHDVVRQRGRPCNPLP